MSRVCHKTALDLQQQLRVHYLLDPTCLSGLIRFLIPCQPFGDYLPLTFVPNSSARKLWMISITMPACLHGSNHSSVLQSIVSDSFHLIVHVCDP